MEWTSTHFLGGWTSIRKADETPGHLGGFFHENWRILPKVIQTVWLLWASGEKHQSETETQSNPDTIQLATLTWDSLWHVFHDFQRWHFWKVIISPYFPPAFSPIFPLYIAVSEKMGGSPGHRWVWKWNKSIQIPPKWMMTGATRATRGTSICPPYLSRFSGETSHLVHGRIGHELRVFTEALSLVAVPGKGSQLTWLAGGANWDNHTLKSQRTKEV